MGPRHEGERRVRRKRTGGSEVEDWADTWLPFVVLLVEEVINCLASRACGTKQRDELRQRHESMLVV